MAILKPCQNNYDRAFVYFFILLSSILPAYMPVFISAFDEHLP